MTHKLKKIKSVEYLMDEYMSNITSTCEKKMPPIDKTEKMEKDNIIIPTMSNYDVVVKYNYNINELKLIAKTYKLKVSGNKGQLVSRIYSYLYFSSFIIKIQKNFRRHLVKKYKRLHGPASLNRKLCTNADDFVTMDPIEEIPFHQFFSYQDVDGFIYGFDIVSLYNLFIQSKNPDVIQNPYNRNIIPLSIIKTIKNMISLSLILKININLHYEDDTQNVSNEKAIELRTLSLFQNINALGNYSDYQWFHSLNKMELIKFAKELNDIWNYRAQITFETKRNICPPQGDPFRNLSILYIYNEPNIFNIKKVILEVLEKLVNNGVDKDSKSLGAFYVLGTLTLVNETAATSLPWLYQSFSYF
jgi:hypothetical protein